MPLLLLKADDLGYDIIRFMSKVSIGRHPNNEIVLDGSTDNTISRHHAKIIIIDVPYLLIS